MRVVVLRDEQEGDDERHLRAFLGDGGVLHIDGHDLGPLTAAVSADGEYEWSTRFMPEDFEALVTLLGGQSGQDILDLLERRYSGASSYELERRLRVGTVPFKRFVY